MYVCKLKKCSVVIIIVIIVIVINPKPYLSSIKHPFNLHIYIHTTRNETKKVLYFYYKLVFLFVILKS